MKVFRLKFASFFLICILLVGHSFSQQKTNADSIRQKMQWFAEQENNKRKFKQGTSYFNIKKIGLQSDFIFGVGTTCNSGGCTD